MKKNRLILFSVLVLLLAGGFVLFGKSIFGSLTPVVKYTVLEKSELLKSISTEGLVESDNKVNLFSTLSYPVHKINVNTGDIVTKGQVLSELDTADLQLNIAQLKAELDEMEKNKLNTDAKEIAIQRLELQLSKSAIKSPINGTVTAVYAKEGENRPGLQFVVEDTQRLKIMAKIKEYDVTRIKEGMTVIIKSDSLDGTEYNGKVVKVHPAAVKNEQAETMTVPYIEFISEIEIQQNTELRIGMNARLLIIIDKKENVLSLPYDAVGRNEQGDKVVYALEQNSQNKYVAKEIKVTTGLETDFRVEVISDQLSAGMKIINDASNMKDQMRVDFMDKSIGDQ
ncbi:efflux RND transporter periplasmic adaptor subunit [Paenibacillus lentus]|uniref:efflux RND transporter periplasmic adaptor subunit n=1 Tax=Paenibacillus lentus TaxID=1338368 RepID=UPI00366913B3